MSKLYENPEIRKEASELVNAYVLHRANELADFALQNEHNMDMNGIDQFAEDMIRYDYDQAALDWFEDLKSRPDDLAEYLADNEFTMQELTDWVLEDAPMVCSDEGLDPDIIEIFEFWAVGRWFANRLEEMGEAVSELFDFTIWGRTTTGQGIAMDYVILSLAENNINARKG